MPPVNEKILPGSAVGMAVSNATSRAFPKAAHHSSWNEYLWINTAAMPSTKATGILAAPPMAAVAASSPKSITSTAKNPNPTSGCNPTTWQTDLSELMLPSLLVTQGQHCPFTIVSPSRLKRQNHLAKM